MNTSNSTPAPNAPKSDAGFSPWQRLKTKRISYLALPLIIMATVAEFVILATGWKYQQVVCVPKGMGVTFFGIGPIGATILAVEALKLPLAIWTASRVGWQKAFMLVVGLPCICILTFQLVKDMAVYEMGVAMQPANELLEKASAEEIKIKQLNGELSAIESKKDDREQRLAELEAKKAKAKTDLEESLKRNEESRQDAITLTEYQTKELSEVEARQAAIIKQFNADTEKLTKAIADLRARREVELSRVTKWNAEEARIENEFKAKMAEYTNKKTAYEKDLAEYNAANILKRQLMKEPIDPGVAPERESNKILKSAEIADIDAEIKAKEAELLAVNNKRRDRVAQVDVDARRLREDFDRRSRTKREEADRKREELLAAQAAVETQLTAEAKQINTEYQSAAQNVDGIRGQIDEARKKAEGFYEAREAAIQNTQVHRIATTVEIVRSLFTGKRPVSITATAKERGDLYTDQISMVRVWVYPVLAFIVAFLPTLMVEIGFSTVFKPEKQRPPHRLGFLGQRMHWLYTRAGRFKVLRYERMAREATGKIAAREQELTSVRAEAEKALAEKDQQVQSARDAVTAAAAEHKEQLKEKEQQWVAKLSGLVESNNRALAENDALRSLQKSEVERLVQQRQAAWAERLSQLQKELDDHRSNTESDREALIQDHRRKLQAMSDDCRNQVIQVRRQWADAEQVTEEKVARLSLELKEAVQAREVAESQLKHQTDNAALQVSQAREETARAVEGAARHQAQRLERQVTELEKALRQREDDAERQLKQREEELSLAFDSRLVEEKIKMDQEARRRESELERQFEARLQDVESRWEQDAQQREEAFQMRHKQREQQLQMQAEARISEIQAQGEQSLRVREAELERQLEAKSREAESRLRHELQQKEIAFHTRLKQREQELVARASARELEMQNQWAADLRTREEEWERQTESRIHAHGARLGQETQQKEEIFQMKLRQREQQLQSQFDARQVELQAQWDQDLRNREQEWEHNAEARARAAEARLLAEMQQKEELFQSKLRQRDQQWQVRLDTVRVELKTQTEQELRRRELEAADARARSLNELEVRLSKEMQAREETTQAESKLREQELISRLNGQLELQQGLARERDAALQAASEAVHQVQDLKRKLMDASSLLTGWKSGNGNGNGNGNGGASGSGSGKSVLGTRSLG